MKTTSIIMITRSRSGLKTVPKNLTKLQRMAESKNSKKLEHLISETSLRSEKKKKKFSEDSDLC